MLLNLTDLSSEPLQQQIIRQIRAMILNGSLAAGTVLPSIRSFAREQRVSVITVQRAYESLARDGLIHSRRGKGFFVSNFSADTKTGMAREGVTAAFEPLIKDALAEGLSGDEVVRIVQTIVEKKSITNTKER